MDTLAVMAVYSWQLTLVVIAVYVPLLPVLRRVQKRQFEAYNRLTAFIMHDIKNLVAQLSLVAKNAAKHKRNPEFIDDAVATIENAVLKMNRLMAQLKSAEIMGDNKRVNLVEELRDVVAAK